MRGNRAYGNHALSSTNERYVYLHKLKNGRASFRVCVSIGHGEQVQIGYFKTIEDAISARDKFLDSR